ncbi:hypothetical protein LTR85_003082 [Meristemomyces frigidus]|nr:hypothetical protein LTR85_003082 [Meristemomyces frigidus]
MVPPEGDLTLQRRPWWTRTIFGKAFSRNETHDAPATPTGTQRQRPSTFSATSAVSSLRKHLPRHNKLKRGSLHNIIPGSPTNATVGSSIGGRGRFSHDHDDVEMHRLAPDVPLPTSPIDIPTIAPALTLDLGPSAFMSPTFNSKITNHNKITVGGPVDSPTQVPPEIVAKALEHCQTPVTATPCSLLGVSTNEPPPAALLSSPMPGTNLPLHVESLPHRGRTLRTKPSPKTSSIESDLKRVDAAVASVRRCVAEHKLAEHGAKRDRFAAFEAPIVPFRKTLVPRSRLPAPEKDRSAIAEPKRPRPNAWLPPNSSHPKIDDNGPEPEIAASLAAEGPELGEDLAASLLSQMEPLSRQRAPHFIPVSSGTGPETDNRPKVGYSDLGDEITAALLLEMQPLSRQWAPHLGEDHGSVKTWFTDIPGAWEERLPSPSPSPLPLPLPSPAWPVELPIRTRTDRSLTTAADSSVSEFHRDRDVPALVSPEHLPQCHGAHNSVSDAGYLLHHLTHMEEVTPEADTLIRVDSCCTASTSTSSAEKAGRLEGSQDRHRKAIDLLCFDLEATALANAADRVPSSKLFESSEYGTADRKSHGGTAVAASASTKQQRHEDPDMEVALCALLAAVEVADDVESAEADHGSSCTKHSLDCETFQWPLPCTTDEKKHDRTTVISSTSTDEPRSEDVDRVVALCPLSAAVKEGGDVHLTDAKYDESSTGHSPEGSDGSPHGGPLAPHGYECKFFDKENVEPLAADLSTDSSKATAEGCGLSAVNPAVTPLKARKRAPLAPTGSKLGTWRAKRLGWTTKDWAEYQPRSRSMRMGESDGGRFNSDRHPSESDLPSLGEYAEGYVRQGNRFDVLRCSSSGSNSYGL